VDLSIERVHLSHLFLIVVALDHGEVNVGGLARQAPDQGVDRSVARLSVSEGHDQNVHPLSARGL